VVDIMAANGTQKPPIIQKIFWAFTEGAAAIALLAAAGDDHPTAALAAVKALPIILGLPFTFLLFWMCQGLLLVCREECGDLKINRKNFSTFLINMEPASLIAMVLPFMPLGQVAAKTWDGPAAPYYVAYGLGWAVTIIFLILQLEDWTWGYHAAAVYFLMGLATAGLRAAVREKLGITGDLISDTCASLFAFPWAIGQMAAEDFDAKDIALEGVVSNAPPPVEEEEARSDSKGKDNRTDSRAESI
jgi:choline-glycine betaine transporter